MRNWLLNVEVAVIRRTERHGSFLGPIQIRLGIIDLFLINISWAIQSGLDNLKFRRIKVRIVADESLAA